MTTFGFIAVKWMLDGVTQKEQLIPVDGVTSITTIGDAVHLPTGEKFEVEFTFDPPVAPVDRELQSEDERGPVMPMVMRPCQLCGQSVLSLRDSADEDVECADREACTLRRAMRFGDDDRP